MRMIHLLITIVWVWFAMHRCYVAGWGVDHRGAVAKDVADVAFMDGVTGLPSLLLVAPRRVGIHADY